MPPARGGGGGGGPGPTSAPATVFYRSLGWTLGFRNPHYTVSGGGGGGGGGVAEVVTPDTNKKKSSSSFVHTSVVESINTGLAVQQTVFQAYLASEAPFGSNIDNYVFVAVEDFQNNYASNTVCMVNAYTKSQMGKNIIGRITLAQGFNSIIVENNADLMFRKREYFGPVNIDKLTISLINRYGEILRLNSDFSLTLELKVLYS